MACGCSVERRSEIAALLLSAGPLILKRRHGWPGGPTNADGATSLWWPVPSGIPARTITMAGWCRRNRAYNDHRPARTCAPAMAAAHVVAALSPNTNGVSQRVIVKPCQTDQRCATRESGVRRFPRTFPSCRPARYFRIKSASCNISECFEPTCLDQGRVWSIIMPSEP